VKELYNTNEGEIYLDERGKIYWHEAFFEALQLELYQYRDSLTFHNEHRLNEEALRMDVLVIKKDSGIQVSKNIGQIFKGSNIFEYKSELDNFSHWDYNKVLAYAYFYSAIEKIPMSDITITIALTIYPKKLIQTLENERGLQVKELGDGIFYIDGEVVPIQIIESKRLSPDTNLFLRNLRSNLSAIDMRDTLQSYKAQRPLDDKTAYLDRLIKANLRAYKEAVKMGALKEIFLQTADENGWLADRDRDRDRDRDIENAARIAKNLLIRGYSVEEVAEATELPLDTVISLVK